LLFQLLLSLFLLSVLYASSPIPRYNDTRGHAHRHRNANTGANQNGLPEWLSVYVCLVQGILHLAHVNMVTSLA